MFPHKASTDSNKHLFSSNICSIWWTVTEWPSTLQHAFFIDAGNIPEVFTFRHFLFLEGISHFIQIPIYSPGGPFNRLVHFADTITSQLDEGKSTWYTSFTQGCPRRILHNTLIHKFIEGTISSFGMPFWNKQIPTFQVDLKWSIEGGKDHCSGKNSFSDHTWVDNYDIMHVCMYTKEQI